MDDHIPRRDFLRTAPAVAGLVAAGLRLPETAPAAETPYPEIGAQHYTPSDYPIRAKRFSEVTVSDAFWKPKIATNAEVTIRLDLDTGDLGAAGFRLDLIAAPAR